MFANVIASGFVRTGLNPLFLGIRCTTRRNAISFKPEEPERDFCPFKPRPEYVPFPVALPRPSRVFDFLLLGMSVLIEIDILMNSFALSFVLPAVISLVLQWLRAHYYVYLCFLAFLQLYHEFQKVQARDELLHQQ